MNIISSQKQELFWETKKNCPSPRIPSRDINIWNWIFKKKLSLKTPDWRRRCAESTTKWRQSRGRTGRSRTRRRSTTTTSAKISSSLEVRRYDCGVTEPSHFTFRRPRPTLHPLRSDYRGRSEHRTQERWEILLVSEVERGCANARLEFSGTKWQSTSAMRMRWRRSRALRTRPKQRRRWRTSRGSMRRVGTR